MCLSHQTTKTPSEEDITRDWKESWRKFNSSFIDGDSVMIIIQGKPIVGLTYTHILFKHFSFNQYMNQSCKNILQFGAASGNFLSEYKKQGWETIGYDYDAISINHLQNHKIQARQIDLNDIDAKKIEPGYHKQLKDDLDLPTNIFAIRILQYLTPKALQLLVFSLMDLAKPGSVFFFAGHIFHSYMPFREGCLPYRYLASFFAARTDMAFSLMDTTNRNPGKSQDEQVEEILVIKKIS